MARAGILSPSRGARREYRFTFQDLVLLRSTRVLLDAAVPRKRLHRTLRQLVRQLPPGRSPSEVQLTPVDGQVLARDGETVWIPESGQMLLPLASPATAAVTDLASRAPAESATSLLNLGRFHQDRGDLPEAIRLYRAALVLEPDHAIVWFNLGTALDQAGHAEDAIQAYRRCLAVNPGMADAHYNLSLLYQQSGHKLAALMHLKRYGELVSAD
jgi:tetratricopeptide (TPR) repeat protein